MKPKRWLSRDVVLVLAFIGLGASEPTIRGKSWLPIAMRQVLRGAGAMPDSDWAMQFLANLIDASADRPKTQETTVLGTVWLAGIRSDLYPNLASFAKTWVFETQFVPQMDDSLRDKTYAPWRKAIQAELSF